MRGLSLFSWTLKKELKVFTFIHFFCQLFLNLEILFEEFSTQHALSGADVPIPANVHTYAEVDGVHYLIQEGTELEFFLSEGTPKLITITIGNIVDDSLDEVDETIIVTLSTPRNSTIGNNNVHTYVINDNENVPSIGFNLISCSNDESVASQSIDVNLSTISSF